MGICKVKDDNIVQTMQQVPANKIDHWNLPGAQYPRRSGQGNLAAITPDRSLAASDRAGRLSKSHRATRAARQEQARKKNAENAGRAGQARLRRGQLANFRDDQFELTGALLAIAISLLAVAALTHLWWLYFLALVPTGLGVTMRPAGLTGWGMHPAALIQPLS
jgi:hypothetical protein